MHETKVFRIAVAGLAAFSFSCAEQPSAPEADLELAAAPGTGCELVSSVASGARSFFSMPTRQTAQAMVRDLGDACGAGNVALTNQIAWNVLRLVESSLAAGTVADVTAGSPLVNAAYTCTRPLPAMCTTAGFAGPAGTQVDFSGYFAATSVFAVRGVGDPLYAVTRSPVPFLDWQAPPQSNAAYWGIEVQDQANVANDWLAATGVATQLVVGKPVGGSNMVEMKDQALANLQFDFKTIPDNTKDFDRLVSVGVCLVQPMPIPHEGDDQTPGSTGKHKLAMLQRERVGLEKQLQLSFCDQFAAPQTASLFGSFTGLLADVMPARLARMFFGDRLGSSVGGLPGDNSRYALIGADVDGSIDILQGPSPVVTAGQGFEMIVQAFTGGGTPAERAQIMLAVYNNSGVPAGAVVSCTAGCPLPAGAPPLYTREYDAPLDKYGVARIENVQVGKAGGYTLCVTASYAAVLGPDDEPLVFAQACTEQFQARNQ